MRKLAYPLAAAAIIALAGCSGGNTVTPPAPAASSQPAPTTAAPAPASLPTWGSTVTWPEGVSVKANYVGTVTASDTATSRGRVAVFTVTVKNGSTSPIDGAMVSATATAGADGLPAETVYDMGQNIGGAMTTILPGETQSVRVGYLVTAAGAPSVRLEFTSVNITDDPIIFKGAVKP